MRFEDEIRTSTYETISEPLVARRERNSRGRRSPTKALLRSDGETKGPARLLVLS